jgi:hypothetical protein
VRGVVLAGLISVPPNSNVLRSKNPQIDANARLISRSEGGSSDIRNGCFISRRAR